jgi:GAF domain-containing protein
MPTSVTFWVNALCGFGVSLTALASLLLILGTGPRQRINQAFALFAAATTLVGVGSAVTSATFWLGSRRVPRSEGLGTPLLWLELAAAGLFFLGPSLLTFGIVYIETLYGDAEKRHHDVGRSDTRIFKLIASAGFLAGFGLLILMLGGRNASDANPNEAGLLYHDLTRLGQLAFLGSGIQGLLALTIFWRNRRLLGGTPLFVSTAVWLIASAVTVSGNAGFPAATLALWVCVLVAGYEVLNVRIFNPFRTLNGRLETAVSERTRELQRERDRLQRINDQQHRAGQIIRDVAQITDPDIMLARLVELIHDRLGYHHIYVFLPDQSNQYLTINAAAGTTARSILESDYRLRIGGNSLAGRVAAQHRPTIAGSQGDDSVYLGDPALPGARAELAVPLVAGERLLGVLDLQSIQFEAFSEEDLVVMTTLGTQLAVALDHCRLLNETEATLAEVEKVQRRYVNHAWQSATGGTTGAPAFSFTHNDGVVPTSISAAWTHEIAQVAVSGQAVRSNGNSEQASVAMPITVRGQIIGALQLRHKPGRTWQADELGAVQDLADRLGSALETARLAEEAQRHAAHERFAATITARMQESLNIDTILRTAVGEIGDALGLSDVAIQLNHDENPPQ